MPTIPNEVLAVLSAADVEDDSVRIIGRLDRKLYEATNKVLEAAGGKWNRKAKAHLFDDDAAEIIEGLIETGEYHRTKQDLGQFDTPPALASEVVSRAEVWGMSVLEPSAGLGNLAREALNRGAKDVFCIEIDSKRYVTLRNGFEQWQGPGSAQTRCKDFLTLDPNPIFDCVVMNPPFAKRADIAHVRHAAKFLKPTGKLVSVMSAGIAFRQDRLTVEFREWVKRNLGWIDPLPDDSFKESGTSVRTVLVKMIAP